MWTEEPLRRLRLDRPDIIILDLGLPDVDGLGIIREVRQTSPVPILVLSSRDDERGKVEALDLGADDDVTKPFGIDELTARLRAALRHRLHQQGEPATFITGDLVVNRVRRLVQKLSPQNTTSYSCWCNMQVRCSRINSSCARYGKCRPMCSTCRIYIKQLRHKVEPDPQQPRYILTETGVGYRLRAPD